MTHDTERISRYLDGELAPAEAGAVEEHLSGCAECRAVLDDLRAIVAVAPGYQGQPPTRDLWAGIASELGSAPLGVVAGSVRPARRGGKRFTLPQLAAAAVLALAVGGSAVWLALGGGATSLPVAQAPVTGSAVLTAAATPADLAWDRAVTDLEAVLREGRDRLQPETLAAIERSLALVDRAIAEAQAALAADPGSADLREWVAANKGRKLDLLRSAATAVMLPAAL